MGNTLYNSICIYCVVYRILLLGGLGEYTYMA